MIKKIFYIFSKKSREEKVRKFYQLMKAAKRDTLLDAGGSIGLGFSNMWNFFERVFVVDLEKQNMEKIKEKYNHVKPLVSDVCSMPFEDKSVDFVFSNAVIEHIDRKKRPLFAKEVRRVARKGYFIITPNYWFPIEPHSLCPLWQYFPEAWRKLIIKYFSIGFLRKGHYEKIDLLTKKELKKLFPEADIIGIGLNRIIPESLACWHRGA